FGLLPALRNLDEAIASGRGVAAAVALSCLLNRTDSWLTMVQLEQGDVADILQNVRWQRTLFYTDVRLQKLACHREVIARSEAFIAGYGRRRLTNAHFPALLPDLSHHSPHLPPPHPPPHL